MAQHGSQSAPVSIDQDGPDMVMRLNGIIVARLTGEAGKRNVQWMSLEHFVHETDKQQRFDKLFAASGQTAADAERCAREAGLA